MVKFASFCTGSAMEVSSNVNVFVWNILVLSSNILFYRVVTSSLFIVFRQELLPHYTNTVSYFQMATIDLLVGMGFPKERAEHAVEVTKGAGVEAVSCPIPSIFNIFV